MTERNWNMISILALVVMTGMLVANMLIPAPTLSALEARSKAEQSKLQKSISVDSTALAVAKAKNAKRLWAQSADEVAATAMAKVTQLALAQSLKVLAFRPQRVQEDGGITRLPYQVSLEGYFPSIVQFVHSLETPSLKLPVVSVQIAAADGASDKVSATVSVVAFRELETKKP